MSVVELKFPIKGEKLQADHGYYLYSAISRLIPALHEWEDVSLCGISGMPDKFRNLHISSNSKLRIRVPHDKIHHLLKLSGKSIVIGESKLHIGIPTPHLLKPHRFLYSRLVIIKMKEELNHDTFKESVVRQLKDMGIDKEPILFYNKTGEPFMRKTIHIKGKEIVGYPLVMAGLDPQESILLQEKGIGGKRKMGCGSFVGIKALL